MSSAGTSRARSRYGSAAPTKSSTIASRALVIILLAVVAAAAFYAVKYFQHRQEVNAQISYVSHEIKDDSTLRVWADISRHRPDEGAYCIVQAFDYSKAEVGRREFAVPADGRENIRVAVDIPTNHPAVAGGAYGCSGQIPRYLDMENPDYVQSS